jgi:TonB family protein
MPAQFRYRIIARILWIHVAGAAFVTTSAAAREADLAKNLNTEYAGKVLIQRHFHSGRRVSYDAAGHSNEAIGAWTTEAEIRVISVRFPSNSVLEITGERLLLVYDNDKMQFWDLFTDPGLKNKVGKHQAKDLDAYRSVAVAITDRSAFDESSARATLNRVFLGPTEHLSDVAPDCWKYFLTKKEIESGERPGEPLPELPNSAVKKVGEGISAPRGKHTPDPEYSQAARIASVQGTLVLWLIVDPTGAVQGPRIMQPLGAGLDEKAVEAVKKWEFRPATQDGEPVAVRINVEVNFRLF